MRTGIKEQPIPSGAGDKNEYWSKTLKRLFMAIARFFIKTARNYLGPALSHG